MCVAVNKTDDVSLRQKITLFLRWGKKPRERPSSLKRVSGVKVACLIKENSCFYSKLHFNKAHYVQQQCFRGGRKQ